MIGEGREEKESCKIELQLYKQRDRAANLVNFGSVATPFCKWLLHHLFPIIAMGMDDTKFNKSVSMTKKHAIIKLLLQQFLASGHKRKSVNFFTINHTGTYVTT